LQSVIRHILPFGAFFISPISSRAGGLKYIIRVRAAPAERKDTTMNKMFVTKAVISKGFEGAPALRFSTTGETPSVRFRVGMKVYDKRAESKYRYVNISVKAFGYLVERIQKMNLDAGACVNIIGRYDEDVWEDKTTHEEKSAPVLIADEIEFSSNPGANGGKKDEGETAGNGDSGQAAAPAPATGSQPSANFTGFESFGGANPFFSEN
jgi:single-stranded DNA-binding protein